jgi:hypothetical protein
MTSGVPGSNVKDPERRRETPRRVDAGSTIARLRRDVGVDPVPEDGVRVCFTIAR